MTDVTSVTAPKSPAASTTIQGAVLQFVISVTALCALFFPKNADQINNASQAIQAYLPMVLSVAVAILPAIHTILGRFKATQPIG